MRVADVMNRSVVTAPMNATVEQIVGIMLDRRASSVAVTDDQGRLHGIVTLSDFAPRTVDQPAPTFRSAELFPRWLAEGAAAAAFRERRNLPVTAIMSAPVLTVAEDDPVELALDRMHACGVYHLVVVREGVPVGSLDENELLYGLLSGLRADARP